MEDVRLLALARDEFGAWNCVPTSFVVSSDSVKLTSIAGSQDGRIFLGGDDGCLYEFEYENTSLINRTVSIQEQLENFYDGTKDVPEVVSEQPGKRSWWQTIAPTAPPGEPPRKCRKLNRTHPSSGWGIPIGGSPDIGGVRQMVVDDERQTLSLITTKGFLQVYDIRGTLKSLKACHLPSTTRSYLDAVSRGQMTPHSSGRGGYRAEMRFPGGGSAAQAGVGGMNGARALTRATDVNTNSPSGTSSPALLPAKLSVISCRESAHLTLLVVTYGGLRLYLSTLSPNVLNTGAVEASRTSAYTRNPNVSPLAPSRVTLCHVRAPPALDNQNPVSKPNTSSLTNWKVDASFHDRGQWLLAFAEGSKPGENIVLSVVPDSVKRPVPEDDPKETPESLRSGGLAESMSLPCDGKTLNGGVVWDFCKISRNEDSGVFDLVWQSPTPANANDLDIPPAYYPPSKKIHFDPSSDRRISAAQPRTTLQATAWQAVGKVFKNFVMSRPLNHGLTVPALTNGTMDRRPMAIEDGDAYRVSQRTGIHGFSTTAGEKAPSPISSTGRSQRTGSNSSGLTAKSPSRKVAKSARLQPQLLRPMTIPLNHMVTHHLEPSDTQIVAVNANGVHTFTIESIISALAKAILSAGELVNDDETVTKFFNSYGYVEGCAMGLALAIGCGPASGMMGPSEKLRELAVRAVMARAYRPKLKRSGVLSGISADATPVATDSSTDPFIPPGYEFHPSSLSQGLMRLFSRLVRAVWNKPLVVVTEGRTVTSLWTHGNKVTPAKVEVLLDYETLSDIRAPLQSMLQIIRVHFKRAIEQVPGVVQRQESMMDIDDGLPQHSSFLTQALNYRSNARASSMGTVVELSQKDAENIAHLIEERNIHSLYRLLSRIVQLLNLILLLRKADSMAELPQIEWGLLHGLTFCQLVKCPEGQDRIENLLNSLIVASASSAASLSFSAQANSMAQEFADNCYLFYPPASRFAYNGIRFAMEALACTPSSRRTDLVAQASANLTDAARQWHSASLISGRLLRSRGNESHYEIVTRALEHGSPLAKAAELLVQLEAVASVVEICLLTAGNFYSRRSVGYPRDAKYEDGVFGWERDLYHKNRDSTQANPSTSAVRGSPGKSESFGASVSEKDAIDTCYAVILHHLSALLATNTDLAYRMVSACTSYQDKIFLDELFKFLHEKNHTDVLLRISSVDVEKWLQQRNDPDLLWRYYDIQGKKCKSGKVSLDRATSEDPQMSIEERIEWLTRASNSLRDAIQDADLPSYEESNKLKSEVNDYLTAARIQHRILQAIESMPDALEKIPTERREALKTTLLGVSDLYEIASAIPLTDLCLVIFHNCREQNSQAIALIWTTLLGEQLLPMAASEADALSFLRKLASDAGREDAVEELDAGGSSRKGYGKFEDGEWIARLANKIHTLGQELYGTGADYTFPVDFLMEFLERLRKASQGLLEPSWPLTVLANASVPYLSLIESYKSLSLREERYTADSDVHVIGEKLTAQLGLLTFWLDKCMSAGGDQSSVARQELSRAHATGELQSHLDYLHSKISVTPGVHDLLIEVKHIEERISYLV